MCYKDAMHEVAVLAMDGAVAFDLAIPCEVFSRVALPRGPAYRVRVCGETEEIRSRAFGIRVPWRLNDLACADTVIIPGIEDPELPIPEVIIAAIRHAAARGARIASICSGTFVLAATGLLDGKRATTHWIAADALAARYPSIAVDRTVLYIDHGQIVTAAGSSAGLDMCLHLVRRDHGQAVAALAARMAVAPLNREGGQAPYIVHELPSSSLSLAALLDWATANSHLPLTTGALAKRAAMSPRTFLRRFKEQTGTTPLQWLMRARVRRAQEMLEATQLPLEDIAEEVGFDDALTMRARFQQIVGVSPKAYRKTFSQAQA